MRLGPIIVVAVVAACAIVIVLALGQTSGPAATEPSPVVLYDTEVKSLASSFAQQEYRLFVALPRGYDQSEARYPVLYVLDADILFGTVTETARLLPLESFFVGRQRVPELIVVGIAYPGGFEEMAQKRGRNFTPTAEMSTDPKREPDGAARFFRFLKEQAIPFVDQTYRTDPGDRTLLGTSVGGLFVLDTLLRHPGTFQRYVATSPRMDPIVFRHESVHAEQHRDMPAVLYLSAGSEGEIEQQIAAGVKRFYSGLVARQYPGLRLFHESLQGENHISAQPIAFTHGLKAVYGQQLTVD